MLDKDLENLSSLVKADLSKVKTENTWKGTVKRREWNRLNIEYYTEGKHRSEYDIKIGAAIERTDFDVLKSKRYQYDKSISGKDMYDAITPFNYESQIKEMARFGYTKEKIDKDLLSWFTRKEKEQVALILPIINLLKAFEYPVDSFVSDYLNNISTNTIKASTT